MLLLSQLRPSVNISEPSEKLLVDSISLILREIFSDFSDPIATRVMELPEVFLKFLEDNNIDPSIYNAEIDINRYICVCPGVELTETEFQLDFPSGVENCSDSPIRFYRLVPPYERNVISQSKLYKESKVIAMDYSSGLAVRYLNVQKGDHVLDLCCAPGTKLVLAGLLAGSEGSVTGVDISPHRLATARSICKKYKLPKVRLFLEDGCKFNRSPIVPDQEGSLWPQQNCFYSSSVYRKQRVKQMDDSLYDKVLVDAQCTHDGSVKHILKCQQAGWREADLESYSSSALESLYDLQLNLLRNGFSLLKPGGLLIYSTCSLSRFQNEDIIEKFTKLEPKSAPSCIPGHETHFLRLDPMTSPTGGFFIARFTKRQ